MSSHTDLIYVSRLFEDALENIKDLERKMINLERKKSKSRKKYAGKRRKKTRKKKYPDNL